MALAEYQKYSYGRKRLRHKRELNDLYQQSSSLDSLEKSSEESSDYGLIAVDEISETYRAKRRRNLLSLSQKVAAKIQVKSAIQPRRRIRSTRSRRIMYLEDGYREDESDITLSDNSEKRIATRRSNRTSRKISNLRFEQSDYDDDFEGDVSSERASRSSAKPKTQRIVENFPTVAQDTEFGKKHNYRCMFSGDLELITRNSRPWSMCQGCSYMYHVECLGRKGDRQRMGHNVIVLDERETQSTCALQCGRCNGVGKNGAITTRCFICGLVGERCGNFRHPQKVETVDPNSEGTKERELILLSGWNDPAKVLFRCVDCERACHFNHLSSSTNAETSERDMEIDTAHQEDGIRTVARVGTDQLEERAPFKESTDADRPYIAEIWKCKDCHNAGGRKVEVILGWRQVDGSHLPDGSPEDFKREYLIKFEDESYARVIWVPGTWLSGVAFSMKRNFDTKKNPTVESAEEVVPEAWLHTDLIFDVRYENDMTREDMRFKSQTEELEAVTQVTWALCKWQNLDYEKCNSS